MAAFAARVAAGPAADDHLDVLLHEVGREGRQRAVVALAEANLDDQVAPLLVPEVAHALEEHVHVVRSLRAARHEDADLAWPRALRARAEGQDQWRGERRRDEASARARGLLRVLSFHRYFFAAASPALVRSSTVIALATRPAMSERLLGMMSVLLVFARLWKASMYSPRP